MTSAISAGQSGAQIALTLLGNSGAKAGTAQGTHAQASNGMVGSGGAAATQGNGTKIMLSASAALAHFGTGSEIARAIDGLGDQVMIQTSGLEIPRDKAAFRQQVLDYLQSDAAGFDARYPEQAAFLQALQEGRVSVQTVDEVPELDWQPDIGWAVYRDGFPQGGGITSQPVGNQAAYDRLAASRGQNIGSVGGHYFYASYALPNADS